MGWKWIDSPVTAAALLVLLGLVVGVLR